MTKRVAVYTRVSTTRQAENDISIPDRLAHAKRYCEERGRLFMREFVDASVHDDRRPEFQALMAAACTDPSPFGIVLVHCQSRFSAIRPAMRSPRGSCKNMASGRSP